ncbi:hypothetical protein SELMODRAFT_445222 [Selaginella moellendorffii]|uniref:Endoplasmic reticulum transmembrane protein n=1 Tax=Selaginella moellendorffii TaxID=88036 RepID=D8SGV1_SELML|nr:uncharacterized protein LOC9661656 [Selaginella moellendorffii]EFJ16413.1 hypothetical protein SELMODRAFT_445222 [Selaginella moellendorffii]|eukprot:XP_002982660.1 uncharacterized protein LOC9661656 [Selaginella moellendorffii]
MALEWAGLMIVVAAESLLLLFLTFPWPAKFRSSIIGVSSSILRPLLAVLPFAGFLLLDVYMKYENRIQCQAGSCTAMDREHYAKSVMKSQRNGILGVFAILLYWFSYRVTHILVDLEKTTKQISVKRD